MKTSLLVLTLILISSMSLSANEDIENGKEYLKNMKFKKAERLFSKLLETDSLDHRVHYYYALTLYNLKKYDKSLGYFSNSIEIHPTASVYRNRGAAYFNLGKYQKALDDYDAALSIDSTDADAYYRRGHTYKNAYNDIVRALEDYTKALKYDSSHAWAYVNRGNIKLELGKYESAVQDYSDALKFNGNISQAYYSRGTAYMKLSNYREAVSDFTDTINRNKKFYLAYYYKGICLESLGERNLAKEVYSAGLGVTPSSEIEIISDIQKRLK